MSVAETLGRLEELRLEAPFSNGYHHGSPAMAGPLGQMRRLADGKSPPLKQVLFFATGNQFVNADRIDAVLRRQVSRDL